MAAYQQMGFKSSNMVVKDRRIQGMYTGAILSPVDETITSLEIICNAQKQRETIFDSQIYNPTSDRPIFAEWPYFEASRLLHEKGAVSVAAFMGVTKQLVADVTRVGARALCSPTTHSSYLPDAELRKSVDIGDNLAQQLTNHNISGIQTALLRAPDLATRVRSSTVASIFSSSILDRYYIVLDWGAGVDELVDADTIAGALRVVKSLASQRQVIVGFCGPEVLLLKAAGAQVVATGHFANLQRFVIGRFKKSPGGGGGGVAYYFSEPLLAFLTEQDIVQLGKRGFSYVNPRDPYAHDIAARISALQSTPVQRIPHLNKDGTQKLDKRGKPCSKRLGPPAWVGLGSRQWMWWFADVENRLESKQTSARTLIATASNNWKSLEALKFVSSNKENDGRWLAPWIRALDEAGL